MPKKKVKIYTGKSRVATEHDIKDLTSSEMLTLFSDLESIDAEISIDIDFRDRHQNWDSFKRERDDIKATIKNIYFQSRKNWVLRTETCKAPNKEYFKINISNQDIS